MPADPGVASLSRTVSIVACFLSIVARSADLLEESDVELMQNMSCKVDAATLKPAQYPANPELEWWVGAAELLELIEAAPLSCPPLPPCRKAVSCVSAELWMLCQPHTHPVDVCNGRRCPPGHGDICPSLLGLLAVPPPLFS